MPPRQRQRHREPRKESTLRISDMTQSSLLIFFDLLLLLLPVTTAQNTKRHVRSFFLFFTFPPQFLLRAAVNLII
jgi:hypothetical protein